MQYMINQSIFIDIITINISLFIRWRLIYLSTYCQVIAWHGRFIFFQGIIWACLIKSDLKNYEYKTNCSNDIKFSGASS